MRLPPGTLLGITNDLDPAKLEESEDQVIGLNHVKGVYPLGLTVFCLPPDEARLAFGKHYQDFEELRRSSLPVPVLENFKAAAENIVLRSR